MSNEITFPAEIKNPNQLKIREKQYKEKLEEMYEETEESLQQQMEESFCRCEIRRHVKELDEKRIEAKELITSNEALIALANNKMAYRGEGFLAEYHVLRMMIAEWKAILKLHNKRSNPPSIEGPNNKKHRLNVPENEQGSSSRDTSRSPRSNRSGNTQGGPSRGGTQIPSFNTQWQRVPFFTSFENIEDPKERQEAQAKYMKEKEEKQQKEKELQEEEKLEREKQLQKEQELQKQRE